MVGHQFSICPGFFFFNSFDFVYFQLTNNIRLLERGAVARPGHHAGRLKVQRRGIKGWQCPSVAYKGQFT